MATNNDLKSKMLDFLYMKDQLAISENDWSNVMSVYI